MDDDHRVDLGVSLFIPYRYMEDRMFRTLQDAGFDDWTLAQCRVFQRVAPVVRASRTSLTRHK